MDLHPLGLDAIAIKPLLQVVNVVFLETALFAERGAVFQRRRFVHVHFAAVVAEHGRVVHVQLFKNK